MTVEEAMAFFREHPELIPKAIKLLKEMEAEDSFSAVYFSLSDFSNSIRAFLIRSPQVYYSPFPLA